jgi:ubiquinone/menaquinone biosynthesis C-methylase UbiE
MTNRKSLFSDQASGYARYRPGYPDALYQYMTELCRYRERALDVATGNGQVACEIAREFRQVDAIDISEQQLAYAVQRPNITYTCSSAEQIPFENQSFDLITVGQAAHWFRLNQFYQEVNRIIRPGGILALFGYGMVVVNASVDALMQKFYTGILDGYWDPERKLVDDSYRSLPFPYEKINRLTDFESVYLWDLETFTGFLETWSAVARFIRQNGTNPVDQIRLILQQAWGAQSVQRVVFPVFLLAARVGNEN